MKELKLTPRRFDELSIEAMRLILKDRDPSQLMRNYPAEGAPTFPGCQKVGDLFRSKGAYPSLSTSKFRVFPSGVITSDQS